MQKSSTADSIFSVQACRGITGQCSYASYPESDTGGHGVLDRMREVLERFPWPAPDGPGSVHKRFRISISGCANGCSRPQIADFGLIRAASLRLPDECEACGECVHTCPDLALHVRPNGVGLDHSRCLGCGQCLAACPSQALQADIHGYRVLVGGRLGRRPRLADELLGIQPLPEALNILAKVLEIYGPQRERIRLGDFVRTTGPGIFRLT